MAIRAPVGRLELLSWVNAAQDTDYHRIEHLCDGVAYCQTFDAVHPRKATWDEQFNTTCSEIKRIYEVFIKPVEKRYQYELFKPTYFSGTLKPNKPLVLFFGPFPADKSTCINYLLGHDSRWTGTQPTTDKFTIIMQGTEESKISDRPRGIPIGPCTTNP
uniref:EH domain-containing protein n=1 Tax=Eutreptiella gymnastica TaxID=73025 RepID=A0A7S1HSL6_9EUGL